MRCFFFGNLIICEVENFFVKLLLYILLKSLTYKLKFLYFCGKLNLYIKLMILYFTLKRELYLNQIIPLIDNELIKVITGIRRCGKSYMLGLIMDELSYRGIKKENIILINFKSVKYGYVIIPMNWIY